MAEYHEQHYELQHAGYVYDGDWWYIKDLYDYKLCIPALGGQHHVRVDDEIYRFRFKNGPITQEELNTFELYGRLVYNLIQKGI